MKRKIILLVSLSVIIHVLNSSQLFGWGTWGHKHINKAAVFALPEEIRGFFYNHIDYITEESVVPDVRKYSLNDRVEGPRHYIDIEDFKKEIDSLPRTMKEALAKYDSTFLTKTGTLPWHIQFIMEKLTQAFKDRNKAAILFLAGDLGHYIADAHMPLHTSSNHDGQLTNQKGIHAFWESHLPEMFGHTYNLKTNEAKYIDNVTGETWKIIKHSHQLADTVLNIDKNLTSSFDKEKIYDKDESGKAKKNRFNQLVHSREYAGKYHDELHGMVENQLRASIIEVADYWYTAWINAGKPDLNSLDDNNLTSQNKKNYKKEMAAWKKGKIINLKTENEF